MVEADEKLNCLGMMCPAPIVKLAKKMKEMNTGQILELSADDEGALEDVPAWCRKTGNTLLETVEAEGSWKFFIQKS